MEIKLSGDRGTDYNNIESMALSLGFEKHTFADEKTIETIANSLNLLILGYYQIYHSTRELKFMVFEHKPKYPQVMTAIYMYLRQIEGDIVQ